MLGLFLKIKISEISLKSLIDFTVTIGKRPLTTSGKRLGRFWQRYKQDESNL